MTRALDGTLKCISHTFPFHLAPSHTSLRFSHSKPKLVPRIQLQIQLHPTTHPVILQRQHILKRPLPLSFEHYLVRLPAYVRGDDGFEGFDAVAG